MRASPDAHPAVLDDPHILNVNLGQVRKQDLDQIRATRSLINDLDRRWSRLHQDRTRAHHPGRRDGQTTSQQADHETRIRRLERALWMAAGFAASAG
jgi:hypothetical protein